MKNHAIVPRDHELVMRAGDLIVSKTDTKGRIVYGNKMFILFSGYHERELLGVQHNIVRHPDMPRGVFKLLWDTIEQGREIFAYVKNLCKDGSFYWVYANVTPSYDNQGNLEGYFSVRRKPNPAAIDLVSGLYRTMLQAEKNAGPKQAIAASSKILMDYLNEKGVSYEEFVIGLQA